MSVNHYTLHTWTTVALATESLNPKNNKNGALYPGLFVSSSLSSNIAITSAKKDVEHQSTPSYKHVTHILYWDWYLLGGQDSATAHALIEITQGTVVRVFLFHLLHIQCISRHQDSEYIDQDTVHHIGKQQICKHHLWNGRNIYKPICQHVIWNTDTQ